MRLHACLAVLSLFLCGCPRSAPSSSAVPPGSPRDAALSLDGCLDGWLADHHLNPFGDPPDTVYAGGDPTFDEAGGSRTPRVEWVMRKHPEARAACAGGKADP